MMLKRNIAIAIAFSGMLLGSGFVSVASAQTATQPTTLQAPATAPGTMPAGVKAEEPTNTGVPAAPAAVVPVENLQANPGAVGATGPLPTVVASDFQQLLDKALGDGKAAPTPEQLDAAFNLVWEKVNQNYHSPAKLREWNRFVDKYKGKLKTVAELETALQDMLGSLEDTSTRYTPAAQLTPPTEGDVAGLGFTVLQKKDGTYVVDYIVTGTPLSMSPLGRGAPITSIGGTELKGKSPAEVQKLMQGKAGEEVEIVAVDGKFTAKVPFGNIPPAQVNSGMLPNNILVVQYPSMSPQSVAQLRETLVGAYAKAKPKGIILDLRGSNGSDVALAQEVASIFIVKGSVVSTVSRIKRDVDKHEKMVMPPLMFALNANKDAAEITKALYIVPLVVLIDGNTAGSSQILAGALKADRASVLGSPTYGSGVGITQGVLPGIGGVIEIGTMDYVTPQGDDLSETGLTPDKGVNGNAMPYAVEKLNEQINSPTLSQRFGGVAPDAEAMQAIAESLAVALMLLGIVLWAVYSHRKQKREEEQEKKKNGRGN